MIDTFTYVVIIAGVVYNGTTYSVGESFVVDAASGDGLTPGTFTGTVNLIVNSDLNATIHREIVRKAVDIQLGIMGEPQRKQIVQADEMQS